MFRGPLLVGGLLDVIWFHQGDWNCNMFSLTKTNMKLVVDLAILFVQETC